MCLLSLINNILPKNKNSIYYTLKVPWSVKRGWISLESSFVQRRWILGKLDVLLNTSFMDMYKKSIYLSFFLSRGEILVSMVRTPPEIKQLNAVYTYSSVYLVKCLYWLDLVLIFYLLLYVIDFSCKLHCHMNQLSTIETLIVSNYTKWKRHIDSSSSVASEGARNFYMGRQSYMVKKKWIIE